MYAFCRISQELSLPPNFSAKRKKIFLFAFYDNSDMLCLRKPLSNGGPLGTRRDKACTDSISKGRGSN